MHNYTITYMDQTDMAPVVGRDLARPVYIGIADPTGIDLAPLQISSQAEAIEAFGSDSELAQALIKGFENGLNTCYAIDIHSIENLQEALNKTNKLPVRTITLVGIRETETDTPISTVVLPYLKSMDGLNSRRCIFSMGKGELFGSSVSPPPATLAAIKDTPDGVYLIGISAKDDREFGHTCAAIKARREPSQSISGQPILGYGELQDTWTLAETTLANAERTNIVDEDTGMPGRISVKHFWTMAPEETGRIDGDLEYVMMDAESRIRTALSAPTVIGTIPLTYDGMSQLVGIAKNQLFIMAEQGSILPVQPNDVVIPVQAILAKKESEWSPLEAEKIRILVTTKSVEMIVKLRHYGCVQEVVIRPLAAVISNV